MYRNLETWKFLELSGNVINILTKANNLRGKAAEDSPRDTGLWSEWEALFTEKYTAVFICDMRDPENFHSNGILGLVSYFRKSA